MKTIILTLIIAFVITIGGGTIYIYSGAYNVSQLSHHNALTKWIINTTKNRSRDRRMKDIPVPLLNDSTAIVTGFEYYNEMCVSCHGGPDVKPWEMTEGLYPKPPKFYKSGYMPDTVEAFWTIKYGIKMSLPEIA